MARTQAQRKQETRARLLAAAADLFAERGFEGVSVDAIADAADRTAGSVYAHFGNKEGLLLALVEAWKNDVAAAIEAEFIASGDRPNPAALWRNFVDPVAHVPDPAARPAASSPPPHPPDPGDPQAESAQNLRNTTRRVGGGGGAESAQNLPDGSEWTEGVGDPGARGDGDRPDESSRGAAGSQPGHGGRGAAGSWVLLEHELWLNAVRNPDLTDLVAERYRDARRQLATALASWTGTPNPDAMSVVMLGLLLGLEMQRRIDPDAVPDHLAIDALAIVLSLAPPPVPSPRP